MTKRIPTNIPASVHQLLLDKSRQTLRSFNELLQYYAMERFLYRLSKSPHAGKFILKGALMFTAWRLESFRPTMDIELLGKTTNQIDRVVAIAMEVCAQPVEPDGLIFNPSTVKGARIAEQANYEGVRIRFQANLGTARVTLQLDIGFGDVIVPAPQPIEYPTLLVRGRKRKFWLVQWPEGKKRPSHKLGWCDQMTESQAERAKRQWMEKTNHRRELAGDSTTLDGFWQMHYWNQEQQQAGDELVTKRPSTQRDMKWTMHRVWLPRFGRRNMDSLKTSEVQKVLASLIGPKEEGKISRQTALKFKTYLSSIFSAAIRLECGLTHNPVRSVKVTAEEPEKPRTYLTPEQAVAIEEKLADSRHRMAWKLNVWGGNRCGEIRGLRWRNVLWELNTIVVTESVWEGNSTPPKTKKGYRKVVLSPKQMAELKKYKDKDHPDAGPGDWVFPGNRNRPLDMGWLMSEHIKPIAEKLGIPRIHWHALRHLNNSLMMNEGVDVATRMDRLGHVTDRVNLIYSHSGDEAQLAASEAIDRRLEAARECLKKKRQEAPQSPSPILTVTQTVTQNERTEANL